MKVENAIIMAAGTSSRFAPLSFERHKALTVVKGDVLIERQIKQIADAGIKDIYIITGYKAEQFEYLIEKFGIKLIHNPEYANRNNNGSIWAARNVLGNSYVCSADNYFTRNPFEANADDSFYAAVYSNDKTEEWCLTEDENGYIKSIAIGGFKAWYMLGHTFWSKEFSEKFLTILAEEYDKPETKDKLWEGILMEHLDVLKMRIQKYEAGYIYEFDTLDELREFDQSYVTNTRSVLMKAIAKELNVTEDKISGIVALKGQNFKASGFQFCCGKDQYRYLYEKKIIEKLNSIRN